VFDVKSSQSLVDDIKRHGGVPVMWKTATRTSAQDARRQILLGGRGQRPHVLRRGLLRGRRRHSGRLQDRGDRSRAPSGPASRLFDSIEHLHATPELKAMCPDDKKFQLIDELSRDLKQRYETIDIDGARVLFPGGGWARACLQHQPLPDASLRGHSEQEITSMKRVIYDALRRYPYVTLPTNPLRRQRTVTRPDSCGRTPSRGAAGNSAHLLHPSKLLCPPSPPALTLVRAIICRNHTDVCSTAVRDIGTLGR